MRDLILVLIGIAVGLGVGYVMWGGSDDSNGEPPIGDEREVWPQTQCPPPPAPAEGTTAEDKLNQITAKVMGLPPEEQTPMANACAIKAQQCINFTPADEIIASGHALTAHTHAHATTPDWAQCKAALDQIMP